MSSSDALSPDTEAFSTPSTTPNLSTVYIPSSISRRSNRPTSLQISRPELSSSFLLEESPNFQNEHWHDHAVTAPFKELPQTSPRPVLDNRRAMESPYFVHSHLDKGALTHNKPPLLTRDTDVGVSKSLQRTNDVIPREIPHSRSTTTPAAAPGSIVEDDVDNEDSSTESLTKQLAETAAGVREMSKQLGRARIQSNIQNVLIVTKARDNRLINLTRELALYLMLKPHRGHTRGLVVYVDNQLRHSKRFDAEGIRRDHPELFVPFPPRRSSSSNSVSSISSFSTHKDDFYLNEEGQLRYWTSRMCSHCPHFFDFVVTLGGDGTVLFTSWLFQRIVPPVLSFALGSLGFLTNFDFVDHQAVMDSAIDSGIRVNLRMRFTCTVYRAVANEKGKGRKAVKKGETGEIMMKNVEMGGWEALEGGGYAMADGRCNSRDREIMCFTTRPVETFEVLNDLVVDRGPSPYVSLLELFGDEHHMTTVQADGLTVSTPTGSTAYSLSAGGSLVHPEIPALLITPICPHTLSFRPMLLPDSMELRICVPYNSRSTAWASFDGRGRVELQQGDHIKVTASKYPFPTVCADNQSTDWFHAISRTLKWNERERQKSFVFVEEDPAKPKKLRKHEETLGRFKAKPQEPVQESPDGERRDDILEEDDEVSDEEDEFDINDSSPEAATSISKKISNALTVQEEILGQEKTRDTAMESALHKAVVASVVRGDRRRKSKSRSRSRSSGLHSGVGSPSRFAGPKPHPPIHSPRHIDFVLETPDISESEHMDVSRRSSGRVILDSRKAPNRPDRFSTERDPDVETIKTPTASPVREKTRGQTRSRSVDYHGRRAFAFWGHDDSDSNDDSSA